MNVNIVREERLRSITRFISSYRASERVEWVHK